MRLAWLREGDPRRAFVVMPLCQRSKAIDSAQRSVERRDEAAGGAGVDDDEDEDGVDERRTRNNKNNERERPPLDPDAC